MKLDYSTLNLAASQLATLIAVLSFLTIINLARKSQVELGVSGKLLISHLIACFLWILVILWNFHSAILIHPVIKTALGYTQLFTYYLYLKVFLEEKKFNLKNFKIDSAIFFALLFSFFMAYHFLSNRLIIPTEQRLIPSKILANRPIYLLLFMMLGMIYFYIKTCYTALKFFLSHQSQTKHFRLIRRGILFYLSLRSVSAIFTTIINITDYSVFNTQLGGQLVELGNVFLIFIALGFAHLYPITWARIPKRFYSKNHKEEREVIQDIEKLYDTLNTTMNQHKLFLNKELTIAELSKTSTINKREIRSVINENGFDNFNDYCNYFKIIETEKQIKEGALNTYSMEKIYHEAGFNSHQTFNRSFRKKHGITPREYWLKVKNEKS